MGASISPKISPRGCWWVTVAYPFPTLDVGLREESVRPGHVPGQYCKQSESRPVYIVLSDYRALCHRWTSRRLPEAVGLVTSTTAGAVSWHSPCSPPPQRSRWDERHVQKQLKAERRQGCNSVPGMVGRLTTGVSASQFPVSESRHPGAMSRRHVLAARDRKRHQLRLNGSYGT